jgi:CheY-like chemotaxis protein
MSHELRTPLNAVIGFSEILRDGLAGELSGEQCEYVGDIYNSGRHLLALINDILDLSKIEAGQMDLQLDCVEPAELLSSGIAMVRERAALHRIALRDLLPPDLGPLCLDARRAKQIVHNLLSNAVKFTPDGGTVTLALRAVSAEEIAAHRPGDDTRLFPPPEGAFERYLEIAVSDTGIGIDAAALRELFQPFIQVDSSLSRRFQGTGLGLTMVQRLVELHGGGLMARSVPGEGSRFVAWLPWREPAETAPDGLQGGAVLASPAAASASRAEGQPGTILVIEDDPRAASLVRVQLEAEGFRVEVVHSGERGLEKAAALQPRAIVLDVLLPDLDGWNTLTQLKEREATRHIPVVIVSITDEPRRGFALGAAQVLVKPVTQDDLLGALAAIGLLGAPPPGERRVLVVDDDPKAVTMVCKHLQAAGFAPLAAFGGQEAIDLARRDKPDAVVLDLMMPHVSGFDVVEQLASREDTVDIPVLVLTAKLITAQDREQLRGRVQRILEKAAFQPTTLLAEVQRALARKDRRREA